MSYVHLLMRLTQAPASVTGIDGLKSTEVAIAMQQAYETKSIIQL